jgi:hypothetical protein
VTVTLPELVELAEVLQRWSNPAREELGARLGEYAKNSDKFWRYDQHSLSVACPFLVAGSCSVYESRPLACRGTNSYDAEGCERVRYGEQIELQVVPGQHQICQALIAGTVDGLRLADHPSGTYELGSAIKAIVEETNPNNVLLAGEENPLRRFMVGSDSNVAKIPINESAKRFVMKDLVPCFETGIDARERFSRATQIAKTNPYAALMRLTLPHFYNSEAEVDEWWTRYSECVEDLENLSLDPAIAFESPDFGAAATFELAYAGKDVRPVRERLGKIFHGYARAAHPALTAPIEAPRKPGKFRLGYVSSRLTYSNSSRWALGWLTEHGDQIETYAFNLKNEDDLISSRWRRNSDHYFHLPTPAVSAAETIRAQDLDALIFTDVGSDGVSFQLSMLRLARTQFAAWGFPMTTGSPTIDFYISSEEIEPPDARAHYSEKLLLLPGSGQCFPRARRSQPSGKSAQELGLPGNGFCLIAQNPMKLLPQRDKIYREISDRTGHPIVVCEVFGGRIGELVSDRMHRAGTRVHYQPYMRDGDFFRAIELADVVLDSFDFGGGMTVLDALTLGNPPISCPGKFMRGRMSIPMMRQAGVAEMIAGSEEDFVALACNPAALADARERCNAEPIYRDKSPVRELDSFLLSL